MKIDWEKAKAYKKDMQKGLCESMPLVHAFDIFNLTKKEDFAPIANVLNGYVQCSSLTNPWTCKIQYEGFCRIWDYAKEKEKALKEFREVFVKNYIAQLKNETAREAEEKNHED